MKINNLYFFLIFFSFIILARFRGGGGHIGSRRGGGLNHNSRMNGGRNFQKSSPVAGGRNSKPQSSSRNNYTHGGNNFNNNYIGSMGYANSWGLMGGMGMGLLLGSAISSSNNRSVTVLNSYNDKNDKKENNENDINKEFDNLYDVLYKKIEELENLSKKLYLEIETIQKGHISAYIKSHFMPVNKINIMEVSSHELYGDFNNEKIKTINFNGNQLIESKINEIRESIRINLERLSMIAYDKNKIKLDLIKNKLINILKSLNSNLVGVVINLG